MTFTILCIITVLFFSTFVVLFLKTTSVKPYPIEPGFKERLKEEVYGFLEWFFVKAYPIIKAIILKIINLPGIILFLFPLVLKIYQKAKKTNGDKIAVAAYVMNVVKEEETHIRIHALGTGYWIGVITFFIFK